MVYAKRGRRRYKRRFFRKVKRSFKKRKYRTLFRRGRRGRRVYKKRSALPSVSRSSTISINNFLPPTRRVIHLFQAFYQSSPGNQLTFIPAESSLTFLCNSLYDPTVGVTGKYNVSAGLFRYMALLYRSYRVYRTSATFEFKQANVSSEPASGRKQVPCLIGILKTAGASGTNYTDWTQLIEDKHRVFCYRWIYLTSDANQPFPKVRMTAYFNERDFGSENIGDDTHTGTTGASPSKTMTFTPFYCFPEAAAVAIPTMHVRVSMKMFAIWSQPNGIENMPSTVDPTEMAN